MAKVDLELVRMILQRNEVDVRTISQILEDINVEIAGQVDEEEKEPKVKKQYLILISDPYGELKKKDYVGWVVQIPEGDNFYAVQERIITAAYAFNQSKKGRRAPIKTIAEACENVGQKYFKEQKVWIKTKEPVLVLTTDNQVPKG
jgi:hypothetical protein